MYERDLALKVCYSMEGWKVCIIILNNHAGRIIYKLKNLSSNNFQRNKYLIILNVVKNRNVLISQFIGNISINEKNTLEKEISNNES